MIVLLDGKRCLSDVFPFDLQVATISSEFFPSCVRVSFVESAILELSDLLGLLFVSDVQGVVDDVEHVGFRGLFPTAVDIDIDTSVVALRDSDSAVFSSADAAALLDGFSSETVWDKSRCNCVGGQIYDVVHERVTFCPHCDAGKRLSLAGEGVHRSPLTKAGLAAKSETSALGGLFIPDIYMDDVDFSVHSLRRHAYSSPDESSTVVFDFLTAMYDYFLRQLMFPVSVYIHLQDISSLMRFAYACMRKAHQGGYKVSPIVDITELRGLHKTWSDSKLFPVLPLVEESVSRCSSFPRVRTYEDIIDADCCFVMWGVTGGHVRPSTVSANTKVSERVSSFFSDVNLSNDVFWRQAIEREKESIYTDTTLSDAEKSHRLGLLVSSQMKDLSRIYKTASYAQYQYLLSALQSSCVDALMSFSVSALRRDIEETLANDEIREMADLLLLRSMRGKATYVLGYWSHRALLNPASEFSFLLNRNANLANRERLLVYEQLPRTGSQKKYSGSQPYVNNAGFIEGGFDFSRFS